MHLHLKKSDIAARALKALALEAQIAIERKHGIKDRRNGLYSLTPGENGGKDPTLDGPWSLPKKKSDCIGAAMYFGGVSRYLAYFKLWGGYINTNSACIDAFGEKAITGRGSEVANQQVFRPAAGPAPGVFVIYPSRFVRGVKLPGYGHIGTGVSDTMAVHCHGGLAGRTIRALDIAPVTKWGSRRLYIELIDS